MIQDRTKSFMYNVDNMISLDNYLTNARGGVEQKQGGVYGQETKAKREADHRSQNPAPPAAVPPKEEQADKRTYIETPNLSTISSLFLDEITTKKKDFLESNSTNYLINKLSHTIDEKLINELPNIDNFTFKTLDLNKIFTEDAKTDDANTKELIKNINKYLTTSNEQESKMLNELNKLPYIKAYIEEFKDSTVKSNGGSIVNALLIDDDKNDKFNLFSIEDTNKVQNDALEILEQPNTEENQQSVETVGGNINIVNKKTRRKKKNKNPKKITRRRLKKK